MLTHIIMDRRAWTRRTLDAPKSWYFTLPDTLLDSVDRQIADWRGRRGPITDVRASGDLLGAGTLALKPVRDELETGRGFVIIDGVPVGRYSPEELQAIYWLVGQLLGRPVVQNVQGTLLYDVRDTGQDVAQALASP